MTLRDRVWQADEGRCVGCGKRLSARGTIWQWSVHHCLPAQVLRRERISTTSKTTAQLCILVCKRCHERHETRTAVIPVSRLPERVRAACADLGPWAEDLLIRYHPDREAA